VPQVSAVACAYPKGGSSGLFDCRLMGTRQSSHAQDLRFRSCAPDLSIDPTCMADTSFGLPLV